MNEVSISEPDSELADAKTTRTDSRGRKFGRPLFLLVLFAAFGTWTKMLTDMAEQVRATNRKVAAIEAKVNAIADQMAHSDNDLSAAAADLAQMREALRHATPRD